MDLLCEFCQFLSAGNWDRLWMYRPLGPTQTHYTSCSVLQDEKKHSVQGCAVEAHRCHRQLTFQLGGMENYFFS